MVLLHVFSQFYLYFRCGDIGHMARNCPDNRGGGDRNADVKCYKCNEYGHFARECDAN